MKTVLVTGAAGFIGSHVARQLLARGDVVVGLDNFNTYYEPARKHANLAQTQRMPGAERLIFTAGDIRDRALLRDLLQAHPVDAIINLAAMAGVRASVDDPALYYDVNLNGTLALLDAARDHGSPLVVQASTSSVYGETRLIPFVETDVCDRPLAPYAASKRAAEMLCYTYHRLYGLHTTVLRFFTVYGPGNRPDMMAYKVADNIFHARNVPLYNDGQMYRDWTYVEDIAAGVVAAADRPLGYEVINLGRGEPVLLADFVRLIEDLAGRRAHLTPAPMPETDMTRTFARIDKARDLLGYNPRISVQEGVRRFFTWYQQEGLSTIT